VHHAGDLAVDRQLAAEDARAEGFADGLVTETDAEEGNRFVRANQVDDAAGAGRRAGTGGDDDGPRLRGDQCSRIEGVVANDVQRLAGETLELLNQIPGEGIVIVDDGDAPEEVGAMRAKDASRPTAATRSPE
jgi:hypothetical protein